ncbi:hypothetical protein [Actinacidiphila acididurans]|uniref:Uncharacterized protein n=1 Tax=Actinacidiphila acididurans TaxID=2784346 RepID=A0ABS2TI23_9ACTN|nr:hypothetical protein [Actinacidiphila acididurans]MBM9502993.1 hypothetical protein [Actinacidiphila acididurans]
MNSTVRRLTTGPATAALTLTGLVAGGVTKSTATLTGCQGPGADTVRRGFNASAASGSWWNSRTAALDAATAPGTNVIVASWSQGPQQAGVRLPWIRVRPG